jgi:hypothetical protein
MSTRGSVAWREGDQVRGVYNHSDSYPTCLGPRVFQAARQHGVATLVDLLRRVTDWCEYERDGICPFCGRLAGAPHSIGAVVEGFGGMTRDAHVAMRRRQAAGRPDLWATYEREIAMLDQVVADRAATGYPDPQARHHQHADRQPQHFDPFEDPLSMEWVYLLLPEKFAIEVWARAVHEPDELVAWPRWSGHLYRGPSGSKYTHVYLYTVSMAVEPDWTAIQQQGRALRR